MMVLANLVNTTGEYILGARVTDAQEAAVAEVVRDARHEPKRQSTAADERAKTKVGQAIGDFYAGFFAIVNLVGLLTQLFLVSRIVRLDRREPGHHDPAPGGDRRATS